jgi:hypothetical protein
LIITLLQPAGVSTLTASAGNLKNSRDKALDVLIGKAAEAA